jgi:hypothetical protein
MIRTLLISLLMAVLFIASLFGAPGCMENSYHLAQFCDPKAEYLVIRKYGSITSHCPCPCKKILAERGCCYDCGHIRYVHSNTVVQTDPHIQTSPALKIPCIKGLSLKQQALLRTMSEYLRH